MPVAESHAAETWTKKAEERSRQAPREMGTYQDLESTARRLTDGSREMGVKSGGTKTGDFKGSIPKRKKQTKPDPRVKEDEKVFFSLVGKAEQTKGLRTSSVLFKKPEMEDRHWGLWRLGFCAC